MTTWQVLCGDVRERLAELADGSVQCCVTSPPYWGLRDYGHPGQIGLESTPDAFVAALVGVFTEVRRVLKEDGVIWLNLGDSYATGAGSGRSMGGDCFGKQNTVIDAASYPACQPNRMPIVGLKPKDLIGIPWRVAFALQVDGWYLRSDIIWAKPNPMPESVTDRPTKSHEYIFLLSKSARYFYDAEAIAEPSVDPESLNGRNQRDDDQFVQADPSGYARTRVGFAKIEPGKKYLTRNSRSVWTIPTRAWPFDGETSRRVRVSWDESDGDTTRITSPDCSVHGDQAVLAAKALCGECAVGSESDNEHTDADRVSSLPVDCVPTDQSHEQDSAAGNSDSLPQSCSETAKRRSKRTSRTALAPDSSQPCMPSAETLGGTERTSASRGSIDSVEHTRESSTAAGSASCELAIVDGETPHHIGGKCSCEYYRTVTEEISHFATFPEELPKRCILAGSREGDTILDPFCGSGTTGAVALKLQRHFIGVELNPAYVVLARTRIGSALPLFSRELTA